MSELKEKLVSKLIETVTSKKFQAFVSIVLLTLRNDDVPGLFAMSAETLDRVIAETMLYIGAVGATDFGKGKVKAQEEVNKYLPENRPRPADFAAPDEPLKDMGSK